VVAGRGNLIADYLKAIELELQQLGSPHEVDTLFIGGGTPTYLSVEALRKLLKLVRAWFPLAEDAEFSVEANPCDITREKVELLAQLGVNRISLGVQSFDSSKLLTLERDHRKPQIVEAVAICQQIIGNVSIDLIFAVPGETLALWQSDIEQAIELSPKHISTYGLTFEKGTTFWSRRARNELHEPVEEDQRDFYLYGIETLTHSGFEHYEVSNFGRPGFRSRHNQQYWLGKRYFAVGPGASRHHGLTRETNHRSTTTYIRRVLAGESPVAEQEQLTSELKAREMLVFGLRMLEGIDEHAFLQQTGFSTQQLAGPEIASLVDLGLLIRQDGRLTLSREGLLVCDSIAERIL